MQDNEYTFRVLRAFRARFRHLNRNHAFPHEDVTQMLNRVVLSEDAVSLEGFKNIILDLLGILVALPGARMFDLRGHLVRYISELLEGNRDPRSAAPLLLCVMDEPDGFDEFDIWKSACKLVAQNRDKEMLFPFLKLPREIRSKIYVFAFENENFAPQGQSTIIPNKISAYHPRNPKNRLAILYANHQIRAEGTKDLFDNFVVHVGNIGLLHRLLNTFSPTTKSLIRTLDICNITTKQTGVVASRLADRNLNSVRNLRIETTVSFTGPWYYRNHGLGEYDKWPEFGGKLEAAVHHLFAKSARMKFTPCLELCGFDGEPAENVTFPDTWNVSIISKTASSITS